MQPLCAAVVYATEPAADVVPSRWCAIKLGLRKPINSASSQACHKCQRPEARAAFAEAKQHSLRIREIHGEELALQDLIEAYAGAPESEAMRQRLNRSARNGLIFQPLTPKPSESSWTNPPRTRRVSRHVKVPPSTPGINDSRCPRTNLRLLPLLRFALFHLCFQRAPRKLVARNTRAKRNLT